MVIEQLGQGKILKIGNFQIDFLQLECFTFLHSTL
jgi:hypothetical protein